MTKRAGRGERAPWQPQYLEKIRVSRGQRPVGEVFAMRFRGVGWVFGRVVRNDCAVQPLYNPRPWPRNPKLHLIYVYDAVAPTMEEPPGLGPHRLLIPPSIVIPAGWSHGYWVPVRQAPLGPGDTLPVHCFENGLFRLWDSPPDAPAAKQYVDEYGNWLPGRTEPCGDHAIGSFGSVEEDIANALGLPYVPN